MNRDSLRHRSFGNPSTNPKRQRGSEGGARAPRSPGPPAAAPRASLTRRVGASALPRRGVSLAIAVVLLAVTVGVLAAAAKTAGLARRDLEPRERAVRAGLLADAAARVARARLAADPAAGGFAWSPDLPGPATATVSFAPGPPGFRRVTVAAVLGAGGETARAQRAFLRVVPSNAPEHPRSRRPLVAPRPVRPEAAP